MFVRAQVYIDLRLFTQHDNTCTQLCIMFIKMQFKFPTYTPSIAIYLSSSNKPFQQL